jgi:hypothetical protein
MGKRKQHRNLHKTSNIAEHSDYLKDQCMNFDSDVITLMDLISEFLSFRASCGT